MVTDGFLYGYQRFLTWLPHDTYNSSQKYTNILTIQNITPTIHQFLIQNDMNSIIMLNFALKLI